MNWCCCFPRKKFVSVQVPLVYNTFEPPQVIELNKPYANGKRLEIKVRDELRQKGHVMLEKTAGSTNECDLVLLHEGQHIGIEVKSQKTTEGGQKKFTFRDGHLMMDDPFFSSLLGTHVPFQGRVPSFLKGDKSIDTWIKEKSMFKGEYISVPNDSVARYYADKGSSYMYIENKGFFHTGHDPCGWNVPMFLSPTRIRIRCKQHGSSSVPGSVMASLVYNNLR